MMAEALHPDEYTYESAGMRTSASIAAAPLDRELADDQQCPAVAGVGMPAPTRTPALDQAQ